MVSETPATRVAGGAGAVPSASSPSSRFAVTSQPTRISHQAIYSEIMKKKAMAIEP